MKRFSQFVAEGKTEPYQKHIDDFVDFACEHLQLDSRPKIDYVNSKKAAMENHSFGGYLPGAEHIMVNVAGRHPADIYRTLAHELVHYKQDIEGRLEEGSGDTGSSIENEANAEAAIIMRNYAKANSGIFESVDPLLEWNSRRKTIVRSIDDRKRNDEVFAVMKDLTSKKGQNVKVKHTLNYQGHHSVDIQGNPSHVAKFASLVSAKFRKFNRAQRGLASVYSRRKTQ